MEVAGKENNAELIKASVSGFIDGLRALLHKPGKESDDGASENTEALLKKLPAIIKTCRAYNRYGALELLSEAAAYSKRTQTVLERIKNHVLHSEYEEAEKAAMEYRTMLKNEMLAR